MQRLPLKLWLDRWFVGQMTPPSGSLKPRTWEQLQLQQKSFWWTMIFLIAMATAMAVASETSWLARLLPATMALIAAIAMIWLEVRRIRLLDELEQLIEWRSLAISGIAVMTAIVLITFLDMLQLLPATKKQLIQVLTFITMLAYSTSRLWVRRRYVA